MLNKEKKCLYLHPPQNKTISPLLISFVQSPLPRLWLSALSQVRVHGISTHTNFSVWLAVMGAGLLYLAG